MKKDEFANSSDDPQRYLCGCIIRQHHSASSSSHSYDMLTCQYHSLRLRLFTWSLKKVQTEIERDIQHKMCQRCGKLFNSRADLKNHRIKNHSY